MDHLEIHDLHRRVVDVAEPVGALDGYLGQRGWLERDVESSQLLLDREETGLGQLLRSADLQQEIPVAAANAEDQQTLLAGRLRRALCAVHKSTVKGGDSRGGALAVPGEGRPDDRGGRFSVLQADTRAPIIFFPSTCQ